MDIVSLLISFICFLSDLFLPKDIRGQGYNFSFICSLKVNRLTRQNPKAIDL